MDSETGLYYYGARYYNPRISIWYGVDPLAEKYPGVSPYVYVADNPIKFIDPDGKKIIIPTTLKASDRNKILRHMRGLTNDKISYNQQTGLVSISSERSGKKLRGTALIKKLINSEHTVTIETRKHGAMTYPEENGKQNVNEDGSPGAGTGSLIKIDPDTDMKNALDINGKKGGVPSKISLGHELLHAEQNADGTVNENPSVEDPDNGNYTMPNDELKVRIEENKLREENNVTPRKLSKSEQKNNHK